MKLNPEAIIYGKSRKRSSGGVQKISLCRASNYSNIKKSLLSQSKKISELKRRASIKLKTQIVKRKSQQKILMSLEERSSLIKENRRNELTNKESNYIEPPLLESEDNKNNQDAESEESSLLVDIEKKKKRDSVTKYDRFLNFKMDARKSELNNKDNSKQKRKSISSFNNNPKENVFASEIKRDASKKKTYIEHSPTYKNLIGKNGDLKRINLNQETITSDSKSSKVKNNTNTNKSNIPPKIESTIHNQNRNASKVMGSNAPSSLPSENIIEDESANFTENLNKNKSIGNSFDNNLIYSEDNSIINQISNVNPFIQNQTGTPMQFPLYKIKQVHLCNHHKN